MDTTQTHKHTKIYIFLKCRTWDTYLYIILFEILHHENISLYISECKPHPMSRFYRGWVRFKVNFVIWYQSHLKPILASVCWVYRVTHYWALIRPSILCYRTSISGCNIYNNYGVELGLKSTLYKHIFHG